MGITFIARITILSSAVLVLMELDFILLSKFYLLHKQVSIDRFPVNIVISVTLFFC
jgi:hypothetical protein